MSTIRVAYHDDVERMMPLVREFYAYEKLTLNEERYRELARELIAHENLGKLLVIELAGELVGYAVIGFGFSLEFGGRDALLDEFYLREPFRGGGLSRVNSLCWKGIGSGWEETGTHSHPDGGLRSLRSRSVGDGDCRYGQTDGRDCSWSDPAPDPN